MAELYKNILDRYYADYGTLEADLSHDAELHPEMVYDEARRQSGLFAKWTVLASLANNKYRLQKNLINNQIWPAAKERAREILETREGRVTVEMVTDKAMQDPIYISAVEIRERYGLVLDIIKGVRDALWHRRDMLRSMSFHRGREENSDAKMSQELTDWSDNALQPPERGPVRPNNKSVEDLEEAARQAFRRSKRGN